MNVFFLDRDIQKSAQAHCDKHVNKMILESAQLMASVHHMTDPEYARAIPGLYRLTHKNHPDAVWARQSDEHYAYLYSLCMYLNEEAQWRYGHSKDHLSMSKIQMWPEPLLPSNGFIEPPKCVHDDFKGIADTVEAYREYYKRDKRDIASWTKRQPPDWF